MFLPISKEEISEPLDFIVVSGDAYVDHPSFGHALIARLIQSQGFSVGIIAQPQSESDYKRLGAPKICFMVASGVVDSMVNNYTVAKKRRTTDDYSEGGVAGKRPDRALIVYSKKLKHFFPDVPIVAGGAEASLRRFAHYDYWDDAVMRSILVDAPIDLMVYGMGEAPLFELLSMLKNGIPLRKIKNVKGTAYITDILNAQREVKEAIGGKQNDYLLLSSFERVKTDKLLYVKAFNIQSHNAGGSLARPLIQKQTDDLFVVQNPPAAVLSQKQMDFVYSLPFERKAHPSYTQKIPALEEVEFSITAHRGCFGGCSFCSINYHQGKAVQSRSSSSIIEEAKKLAASPDFKGYIHDVGGPSANFHQIACDKQKSLGVCPNKNCIGYEKCSNLIVSHKKYLELLRELRKLEGIKKVFIRSGVRYDYLLADQNEEFFDELVKYHISGQLKVAPEHCSDNVLRAMNKPPFKVYREFYEKFRQKNAKLKMNQFLVPYFISSHPGCTLDDAVCLTEYLMEIKYMPKQVQDFYPTPSTKSTTMYYAEMDTHTLKPIFVAKTQEQKAMQRALLQYRLKQNRELVKKALKLTKKEHLLAKI